MHIGIDIMGSDFGPQRVLEGVVAALPLLPEQTKLVLVGDEEQGKRILDSLGVGASQFIWVHATEVIEMGEHPAKAVIKKTDSSIVKGFNLLKSGEISAFASGGNTGAMMAGAMMSVKTIPGVIRPAIASMIPKESGKTGVLLDVGANADVKPDNLFQFGILGKLYAQHVLGHDDPRVGLMNIGEEEEKGSLLYQAAHKLMLDAGAFNFHGNVEGRDLFNDKVDVISCDGFVGNIMLKLAESFYRLSRKRKIQDEFFDKLNYEQYGGSPILGVNGNVIIGHGSSSVVAIQNMILQGVKMTQVNLQEKIAEAFN